MPVGGPRVSLEPFCMFIDIFTPPDDLTGTLYAALRRRGLNGGLIQHSRFSVYGVRLRSAQMELDSSCNRHLP